MPFVCMIKERETRYQATFFVNSDLKLTALTIIAI